MALKSGFFNSIGGDRKYGADDLSNIWVKFISNGVYANPATSMQVVAAGGMNVKVSPGWAFVNSKWLKNDSDYIITLDDSDVEFNRLDRIVVRLNPLDDVRAITIEVKKGTAASPTPIVPLTREENGIWELSIAQVWVFANTTEISQSAIIDQRADTEVCGWVTGLVDQIDTKNLFAQYDAAFKEFMDYIRSGEMINAMIGQKLKSTLTYFGTQLCGTCNVLADWESFPGELRGYGISKADYNPDKGDILLLWVNNELWELNKDYTLTDDVDYWRIACGSLYGPNLTIQVWRKNETGSGTIAGECVVMAEGEVSEAVAGVALNITASLKSLSSDENAKTEFTTGRLCTNVGGLCTIFVMHRDDVTIDGEGWQSYSVRTNNLDTSADYPFNGVTVFYKTVNADEPFTATVTQASSQRLNVNALIFENYNNLVLVESVEGLESNSITSTKSKDGLNVWCVSNEYANGNNDTFNVDDSTLAVYASYQERMFIAIDESGDCANEIAITNLMNEYYPQTSYMHFKATREA